MREAAHVLGELINEEIYMFGGELLLCDLQNLNRTSSGRDDGMEAAVSLSQAQFGMKVCQLLS